MNGLNLAGEAFGKRFKVTDPGMRRAHWAHNSESLKEKSVSAQSDHGDVTV
jgi:xeroderma pigmentosum group C-complementing protein